MNDNDYYKLILDMNKEYAKKHKFDKLIQYLKDNHLSIIALIISIIALFKD